MEFKTIQFFNQITCLLANFSIDRMLFYLFIHTLGFLGYPWKELFQLQQKKSCPLQSGILPSLLQMSTMIVIITASVYITGDGSELGEGNELAAEGKEAEGLDCR